MWDFAEYVARVRPQIAVFESVQLAFTRPDGLELMRALRQRLEERTGDHWTLTHVLHDAYSIGGVAHRRRYFWVVSRVPFGIEWPHRDRLPVLDDAIGDLENLPEGWSPTPYTTPASWWASDRRRNDGIVDGHQSVRTPLVQRVVDLLSGVEWNEGEHLARVAKRHYDTHGRLPDSWRSTEEKVVANGFNLGFNTPVRWRASDPARVITGAGPIIALHPRLPRMFTHREVARVMGYPDTWLIEPLKGTPGLVATWGKGITVDCGRWIGEWIRTSLEGSPGSYIGEPIGDREFLIDVTNTWTSKPDTVISTLKKFKKLLGGNIMTEPEAPAVPVADGEAVDTAVAENTVKNTGTGRPRPQATIDQDAKVLEYLSDENIEGHDAGKTKEELATALELPANKIYLSLWRLKRDEKIHKTHGGGAARWHAGIAPSTPEAPASEEPVAAPAEPVAEDAVAI
jgi:site-specific DNA-cytosine methylase